MKELFDWSNPWERVAYWCAVSALTCCGLAFLLTIVMVLIFLFF